MKKTVEKGRVPAARAGTKGVSASDPERTSPAKAGLHPISFGSQALLGVADAKRRWLRKALKLSTRFSERANRALSVAAVVGQFQLVIGPGTPGLPEEGFLRDNIRKNIIVAGELGMQSFYRTKAGKVYRDLHEGRFSFKRRRQRVDHALAFQKEIVRVAKARRIKLNVK
jgi:hypothetical protein